MCLSIPAQIISVSNDMALVEIEGNQLEISIQLLEGANVGDYVLVHAGFALQKIDLEEARETLLLIDKLKNDL